MEVTVPDIGDFKNVPIIGILVRVGDVVAKEDPLIELESDKATMEVPSPAAGLVKEIKVQIGDKVSQGSLILVLEGADAAVAPIAISPEGATASAPTPSARAPRPAPAHDQGDIHAEVVVLGSGPGGLPRPSVRLIWAKKRCLLSAIQPLAGFASTLAVFPRKRFCMWPK